MPAAEPTVSEAELARLMGVTRPAVTQWRQAGCPFRRKGGRFEYVVAEVVEWRLERAKASRSDEKLDEVRERTLKIRAERMRAEHELRVTLSQAVLIDDYETALATILDRLMAGLRSMPPQFSHFGPEIEAAVEVEVERVIVELNAWDEDVAEDDPTGDASDGAEPDASA